MRITFSVTGDVIYELESAPGMWQEQLLEKHKTYSPLLAHVQEMLKGVEPSQDGELVYYPCRAVLKSGVVFDAVYIVPEKPYINYWGVYPENDPGKRWIGMEDIAEVEESPIRLPAQYANEIYEKGESGMGYTIFTVVFADGARQACVSGNAIDFIRYPVGKGPKRCCRRDPARRQKRQFVNKFSRMVLVPLLSLARKVCTVEYRANHSSTAISASICR